MKVLHNLTNKSIWNIAYPIMLGNMAQTIITITDTAFMGQIGEVALGASSLAAIYYYVFSTLAWGFALGVQVIVARRFGEGQHSSIGVVFDHGLLFVSLLGILLFSLLKFLSPAILHLLISSDSVYATALEFTSVRSYGILFVCFNYLFRSLYVGLSDTKVISYTTILMAVVNIVLDYVLVFGKWGFPRMGVEGAALASVIAEASALLLFLLFTLNRSSLKRYALFQFKRFERQVFTSTLMISLPSMGQKLISFGTWLVFFAFVERMGERALASTMTMRSIYMLINIPLFAYATTANTLISRRIGEGDSHSVLPIAGKVLKLCFFTLLPITLLLLLFPRQVLSVYTENTDLINYTLNSMYTVVFSAYCLGFGIVLFEAISGTSNTDHGMYVEMAVLVLYVATSWLTASLLKLPIEWVWMAETVYGLALGVFSYIYLKRYNWQSRKRI